MRARSSIYQSIDWITVALFTILVLIGWINVYAAVYNDEHKSIFDMDLNYGKQLVWIITSGVIALVILLLDAKFFSTLAYFIYLFVLILLFSVLVFGIVVAGSKSWFQIGNFSLQPAEFAKFATCLALAKYLSKLDLDIRKLSTKIIAGAIIVVPAVLILLQHDTGSAVVFVALVLVLYREGLSGNLLLAGLLLGILFLLTLLVNKFIVVGLMAGITFLVVYFYKAIRKQIVFTIAIFLLATGYVFSVDYVFENILEPHQKNRVNVLLGKEKDLKGAGYNVNQSIIAIGSGGFIG